MDDQEKPMETPYVFLMALGESLKTKEGIDADLVAILTAHILTATPVQNAVVLARDAIVTLANARANPPKMEGLNG